MENSPDSASVSRKVSGTISVQTPEQIQFTFELAGIGPRALAYLIDLSVRLGIVSVAAMIIGLTVGWASEGLSTGLTLILLFAVEWGYGTLLEWRFNGSTPGKKALGIRVLRTDGVSLDFTRSAMRNLLRAADIAPLFYATGVLVMFFTGTQRRLGDLAADTMVVRERKSRLKELPPMPADPVEIPAGAMRRMRIRDRDLALVDEFFRRRHLFSADRANEIATILAGPVGARLGMEGADPERLLAGMLLAGHEVRSSWYGRTTTAPLLGDSDGGAS